MEKKRKKNKREKWNSISCVQVEVGQRNESESYRHPCLYDVWSYECIAFTLTERLLRLLWCNSTFAASLLSFAFAYCYLPSSSDDIHLLTEFCILYENESVLLWWFESSSLQIGFYWSKSVLFSRVVYVWVDYFYVIEFFFQIYHN